MKIRAKILDAARSWFKRNGFVEVQGPVLIPALGEWPNYFEVKYFGKKAYLARGLQPYAETIVASLGKIYTITPVFRAEKARTQRHLTEYWQIEAEIPRCDLDGLIEIEEQLVSHVCQNLSKEAQEELERVQRDTEELKKFQPPFPRFTYDDAIKTLQKDGFGIQWGTTIDWDHEKHLSFQIGKPFFISEFPTGIETLFYRRHRKKPELSLTVDLFAPEGYGEISTGGQPAFKKEDVLRKMRDEGIGPQEQEWYMRLKQEIPYSGFALGVERLTQWVCKLEHVKDASAFPRLTDSTYP